jgi:hypothetical protein
MLRQLVVYLGLEMLPAVAAAGHHHVHAAILNQRVKGPTALFGPEDGVVEAQAPRRGIAVPANSP